MNVVPMLPHPFSNQKLRNFFIKLKFKIFFSSANLSTTNYLPSKTDGFYFLPLLRRTPMPKCDWNHTSAWVFSCKFAAEHLFKRTSLNGYFWLLITIKLLSQTKVILRSLLLPQKHTVKELLFEYPQNNMEWYSKSK